MLLIVDVNDHVDCGRHIYREQTCDHVHYG